MRPSLQISALDTLPLSLRKIASSAAAGSLGDLVRLAERIPSLPAAQQLATLPVFYLNADPTRIPSATQLDSLSLRAQNTVARARTSLRAVGDISNVPPSAFSDLWLNLWPWYLFFQSYGDELPDPEYTEEEALCIDFQHFVSKFRGSAEPLKIMYATPDFRMMLTRFWAFAQFFEGRDAILSGYDFLALFLFPSMKGASYENLTDVVEGAGGSSNDVTDLVVNFIQDLLPEGRNAAVPEHLVVLLELLLDFVSDMEATATRHLITPSRVPARFQLFMSPADIGVLTRMIYALVNPTPGGDRALDRCLTLLCQLLTTHPGPPATYAALDNNLMHAITILGLFPDDKRLPQVEALLDEILPASLAYYRNVESMDTALTEIRDMHLMGEHNFP
ncbi:hypothetical protein DFH06DRAFT_1338697 [Mycena polygramma]|nr:hypothetical protein DFH06DRAFT_1338697 [Mycena polygramma]